MKICIAASGGGHLSEIMQLKEFYSKHEHFFLSFKRQNSIDLSKKERVFFVSDPKRNPFSLIKNFFQSLKIFLKEKPDLVLSTGAGVALSIIFIAKLCGKKIIFIESFCRIKEPSLSGKIVYGIADLFLVQWKENLKFYPKAVFAGSVF